MLDIAREQTLISIISPVYRAQSTLSLLVQRITEVVDRHGVRAEIILVDDHSPDDSWKLLRELAAKEPRVRAFRLSRNFGQHYAITAGLEQARGQYAVIMDCDLQDNPDYIPEMLAKVREGPYDVVLTRREYRDEGFLRRITARLFYCVFNWLAENQFDHRIGGYSLISREVIDSFLSLREYHRHYSLLLSWVGYNRAVTDVVHAPRAAGKSTYTLPKLVGHALNGIVSQSDRLLKVSFVSSLICFTLSVSGASYILIKKLVIQTSYNVGWPSVFVAMLFGFALVLLSLGVIGIYVGKIFEQTKGRPLYLISDRADQAVSPAARLERAEGQTQRVDSRGGSL